MRRIPAPTSISPEAQAFINSTTAEPIAPVAVETIQGIRDHVAVRCQPLVQEIQARYGPEITESTIATIPVQIIRAGSSPLTIDAVILYFFGGGFVTGGPTSDQLITVPLAHKTGAKIYAPYYRLAPEHPFPAAPDDCFEVYKALLGTVGAERIAIAGESAGGNLALSVLIRARQEGLPMPRAAGLFSPVGDMLYSSDTINTLNGIDPTLTHSPTMDDAYAAEHDRSHPWMSPVYASYDKSFPATLITTGTRDLLLSECARLSTVMRHAGVDVSLHVWEGMWHVFEYYPHIPEGQKSLDEMASFLVGHLNGPA